MASTPDNLYITFVDVDRDLLKIWGQRSRIGATYIERQLLQLIPEFNRTQCPSPTRIHKGMFCFAKYTDGNYYRARVISNVQGDLVGVLFVDYGNKDFINISNVRVQEGIEGDVLAKMAEQAEEFYLARVKAPNSGWTKEIVSEVRRDICYEEFICQTITQVGDQKILEIKFHNEDFSNYLVNKQFASPISLPTQRQMILSYCSLVSPDSKQTGAFREMARENFPVPPTPLGIPGHSRTSRLSYLGSEPRQPLNFEKQNPMRNFSQSPSLVLPSKHASPVVQNTEKTSPTNSFYPPLNPPSSKPPVNENSSHPPNPVFNPLLCNQYNLLYQMKGNPPPLLNSLNNVMIEAIAKQIKQYITEDEKSDAEKTPHNYVSSVLEVGNAYNVFISCIDDGPWSFSVRLISSESELEKLINELSSCKLVPVKPPIVLGHPCIGLSEYGNYCRGVIVSVSHSAVKVYFVDFGNTEDLPVSSIYELPTMFFKTRVLSQKFSLSGLQKVAYSEDIKKFFSEVVQDKLLMLRVVSLEDDNLPTCELYLKDKNIKWILNEKFRELRSLSQEKFPEIWESENVVVTWVISPQKFFVQLRKKDLELSALKNELAEVETKGQAVTFQQLCVGFKCVCHYVSDGQWYRVMIMDLDSEDAITVFYIDYGNTEKVRISLLKRIDGPGLINQMSAQAIRCSLKGFENQPFDQEMASKLEALILEKDLKMTVVSSDKHQICVQLFENGNDIAHLLSTPSPPRTSVNVNSTPTPHNENLNRWKSPPMMKTIDTSPQNKSENKSIYSENAESFEKREKNVRGDKMREKNNSSRHFYDLKSDKTQFWPTHAQLKRRSDDKGNWRETPRKTDDLNFYSSDKFSARKSFKPENNRSDRKPADNHIFSSPGSRGARQGRGDGRKSDEFDDRRKLDGHRGGRGWMGDGYKGFGSGEEGRRFDKKSRSRDDSFKNSDSEPRRKFTRDRFDRSILGREKRVDEHKRKPIRKEDAAPPGSKFEKRVLEMGSSERGIVTYYFNPHEFYVQLLAQEEDFKKMMQDIQNYYCDKYSLRDPSKAGDIVIAQFSVDKILYRAEVIKPSPVTVRYVDYGNQEPVGPKGTWLVDKQFLKLPVQVIRCRLSNIRPMGSEWPPPGSEIEKFFESEEYKCTFLGFENETYEIRMEATDTGKDVATEVIAAGLARLPPPELEIPEIDFSLLSNQVLRLYISHIDCSSKFYVVINPEATELIQANIKAFAENKTNLTPMDESSLKPGTSCLSTDDGVSWYRGTIIKTTENGVTVWLKDRGDSVEVTPDKVLSLPEHLNVFQSQAVKCSLHGITDSLNEEEFKSVFQHKHHLVSIVSSENESLSVVLYGEDGQKAEIKRAADSPQTVEPIAHLPIFSQKIPVVVSHSESPKETYIQRLADSEALGLLTKKLSEFYSGKEGFDVEEGDELVAVKPPGLETWYRGRVVSSSEESLDVFYIDYGNKQRLPSENVKKLNSSFFNSNAFAKKVSLDVESSEDVYNKFVELTKGKELLAYFINTGTEFFSEFVVDGKRITPLLTFTGSADSDKFRKILPGQTPKTSEAAVDESAKVEETDDDLKVFLSHIDSPHRFWVHHESRVNDLHQFQDKLQKCCENLEDVESPQVHDTVAALFSELWYRARVLNVDGKTVTVQFIDYGNSLDVDLNENAAKKLTPELIDIPTFATLYSLKGSWNEDMTSSFEEIILQSEDPVSVVVLEEGEPPLVDLLQNGESIAEKLMEEKLRCSGEPGDLVTVYITHSDSPDDFYIQRESCTEDLTVLSQRLLDADGFENASSVQENEMYAAKFSEDEVWYRAKVIRKFPEANEVLFVDYGNTSTVTEIKSLPPDLVKIPHLAENCCLVYGNHCDTWSEAACDKFSEYADNRPLKMKVVVSRSKKSIVRLYHENENISEELENLCEPDGRSQVFVSHAQSPTDFYIQYVDDEEYKLIAEALDNGSKCEDLEDKNPGTLCQARFADDGLFYRAKILQNLDEGCEVFFIDFGSVSVSSELKKLPQEIENIPPRALRCSLDLREKNIQESVKEEFINLTQGGEAVFHARVISPGEVNILSLKLDGRILEETLTLDAIPDENVERFVLPQSHRDLSDSLDDETDDDKNSKINGGNYVSSIRNETDEEKRVKIAIADGGSEGFKSDDEKGISEVLSSIVNATDNELIEEIQESSEEAPQEEEDIAEAEVQPADDGDHAETEDKTESEVDINRGVETEKEETAAEETAPESVSTEESVKDLNQNITTPYRKLKHCDKILPGSVSMGASLETLPNDQNSRAPGEAEKQVSQSAPSTPKPSRRKD